MKLVGAALLLAGCGSHAATDARVSPWTTATALPHPLSGHAACAFEGQLFVMGSDDESDPSAVYSYDPATDLWSTRGRLTKPRGYPGCAVVNGTLQVFGGVSGGLSDSTGETYDPASDSWHAHANPQPFSWGAALAVANGTLYAISGVSATGDTTQVSSYDPATDTWHALRSIPSGRISSSAIAASGNIYVFAGQDVVSWGPALARVDRYDIAANTWSSTVRDSAMISAAVTTVADRIYVSGLDPASSTMTTQMYDPVADVWGVKTPDPTPRTLFASDTIGDRLYVTGGTIWNPPAGAVAIDLVEVYSPSEDK